MPESWDHFLEYAAFARVKPAFDLEERDQPLRIAEKIRAALDQWAHGENGLPVMLEALPLARICFFVNRRERRWFQQWAAHDDSSLRRVLVDFQGAGTPTERFAAFARAAEEDEASGLVESFPEAAIAIGSLLNFALDPHSLPVIQPRHLETLQAALGFRHPSGGSLAKDYESHLGFVDTVRERLLEASVPVRDMLDVQALVLSGGLHVDFWAPGREAERPEESAEPGSYLSICAIYKDEAPYLREWIEFHRLVGVDRFFLYDNESGDDPQRVLAPYVQAGVVVLHEWPGTASQVSAYLHCMREYRDESRWIAFIDLDEFLFSPQGQPLPELLAEYERFPGVAVNWVMFGPSGHEAKPPGLVIESYVQRVESPLNTTIKSIANPRRVAECTMPHGFQYDHLSAVDENGYPVTGKWTKSASIDRLRVNHYFTKSVEEYRWRRSRADGVGELRQPMQSMLDPQAAGEYDGAILRYVPELRSALSEAPELLTRKRQ